MLLRAFGAPGAPFLQAAGPVDPAGCLAAARRFEVSPRVAARQGRARLAAELGPEAAAGFQRDLTAAAAQGLRIESLVREVHAAASERDIDLVLLKYAAIEAAGLLVPGSRGACDLDVLVPPERTDELQAALIARGFRSSGLPDAEHQLPALLDPAGGMVEVHRLIPGVRPDGGRSATVAGLSRAGLLEPLPGREGCFLPAREAQIAHVLVHGIGQHGFWPGSYPLLRMVGDLIDLGFHGESSEELARRAAGLVARDLAPAEARAVRGLCRGLAAGEDLVASPTQEGVLLRHILAGRLDADYAAALRLSLLRSVPSERRPAVRMAKTVLGAVFLTRAQIDAIYGRPRHRLGYLGWRLARPFDLLSRLWRYGARARRLKM